ncbi:MAG TPA: magnesium transporter CorA family protein [Gaiellaceae bacterium]
MAETRWIDLLDPSQEELEKAMPHALHERALSRLLAPATHEDEPRPTLESHEGYVFGIFLVAVAVPDEDRIFYQEVDLVATGELLITVRKTPPDGAPFGPASIRDARAGGATGTGMLVYALVDEIAERYLSLVDTLEDEIDELEEGVESLGADVIRGRISGLRHDLLHVRRTLTPTRDSVRRVLDGRIDIGGKRQFTRAVELHFEDAYDKLLRASEGLELARDLVAGVRDYSQAKIAIDQNEVMKRLTAIASMLLVPTFIVGLYGQNFHHIPELSWGFGYWWAWGWIVGTTIFQVIFFRRKHWL